MFMIDRTPWTAPAEDQAKMMLDGRQELEGDARGHEGEGIM
jgi:hypothetical protein